MAKKGTQLEENRSDSKDNIGLPDEATRISVFGKSFVGTLA